MKKILILLSFLMLVACSGSDDSPAPPPELPGEGGNPPTEPEEPVELSDEELMDLVQERTFAYFWDFAETNSGGARERYIPANPSQDANIVTSGGTGFGLMSILVGIERGYISRGEGFQRITKIVDFLENADRFHGAWPHWMEGATGNVIPFSDLDDGGDLVETALLVQGLICVQEYFNTGSTEEANLASKVESLWKGVEWNWYSQNQNVLYWHWSPNNDFAINLPLKGWNETLITYVLAAASPDFGIDKVVYDEGWASNGNIVSSGTQYSIPLLVKHGGNANETGPLFFAHYSFLGLNPNGLSDQYANYLDVNKNHSLINYSYCVDNPKGFTDYGENCWGLTASYTRNNDGGLGYSAHSPSNDLGVISPTAAISSIPYTPEESLAAMQFFYGIEDILLGPAGFYDAFSPQNNYWVGEAYLAIDQGPQIIMIENYRSGLLWDLFMKNEDVKNGLDRLGFSY
ncbi:beta-glucosidase [Galbibacter sp. BG1]|uniref:glucoamylase family protein n=1 Tax=Galbibacter sp. BG1 TaxID=1170699 RepID=UPI0015BA807C|nr:glucoamylase family protein [Galbibacter sp. BG1]QLE02250.1 beta-glucosidase [Galbibacter sp. BG1]